MQWMQKALDQMNVQVHRAVTHLTGVTGMAIVRAIVAGERDPHRLAAFRHRTCRKTVEQIAQYLTGTWREEHLFNLASALRTFDAIQAEVDRYEAHLLSMVKASSRPSGRTSPFQPTRTPGRNATFGVTVINSSAPRCGDSPA